MPAAWDDEDPWREVEVDEQPSAARRRRVDAVLTGCVVLLVLALGALAMRVWPAPTVEVSGPGADRVQATAFLETTLGPGEERARVQADGSWRVLVSGSGCLSGADVRVDTGAIFVRGRETGLTCSDVCQGRDVLLRWAPAGPPPGVSPESLSSPDCFLP